MQGLRLVPLSFICFYQPMSRAGWFGATLSFRTGTLEAVYAQLVVIAAAVAGWWAIGRYYSHHFGEADIPESRWEFWARFLGVWMVWFALLPASRGAHVDLGALWFASLCLREVRLSRGSRPHYLVVAGGLIVWAFVPLLISARDPGAWAMSDLVLGTCGLVIAVGDHLALLRSMHDVASLVRHPPFSVS